MDDVLFESSEVECTLSDGQNFSSFVLLTLEHLIVYQDTIVASKQSLTYYYAAIRADSFKEMRFLHES